MVLIEADTGGEWKVGADAHEHLSPVPVINVKVVSNDPTISELKMPSVRNLVAKSDLAEFHPGDRAACCGI
jgi:hypothetical protein